MERVRFTSPHPKDLRPETIEAMAEVPAVCEHLHLPLQSGSDRVLRAMRRGYSADRYLARLAAARAAVDDLAVTTDIIVGFPGETDHDFERTLEVAAEAAYDSAYTFIFSPRAGTRAAAMTDSFVPDDVVAERFERLRAVVERSALLCHQRRVGRTEEVLVEGPSARNPAVLTGRTRQNKLVHFPVPDRPPAVGSYGRVRVDGAAPHHLTGVFVSAAAPALPPHPDPRGGRPRPGVASPPLALVGPTASGKSALALEVATRLGGVELVTADAMTVYRHMDLGTAKPTPGSEDGPCPTT